MALGNPDMNEVLKIYFVVFRPILDAGLDDIHSFLLSSASPITVKNV